jgi:hypothetical protein
LKKFKLVFLCLAFISTSAFADANCATYASIRKYDNVKDTAEVARIAQKEFLPLMKKLPGFVSWELIVLSKTKEITISRFRDKASAEESAKVAKEWGAKSLSHLLGAAPEVNNGEIIASSCF